MATISSLRIALEHPELHFKHLKDIVWNDGIIVRSTYFAQTFVKWKSRNYLLNMPLCATALRRVERFLILQRHLRSGIVPKMELMRDEMLYQLPNRELHHCDILLEPVPDALPYADAVASINSNEEISSLLDAINVLEKELLRADISHNNLRKENLLLDAQGVIYPIRWYYATDKAGGDSDAIKTLREEVGSHSDMLLNEPDIAIYSVDSPLDKYLYAGELHEGLIAVANEYGWGFVDCNCEEVIPPQYVWVGDFREGRAEVETEQGMGLIDREGNYIIEPIYETVEFEVENGWSRVGKDGQWALFNYSGEQLSPWENPIGGGSSTL